VLLSQGIRDDNQKELDWLSFCLLNLLSAFLSFGTRRSRLHVLLKVRVNGIFKVFNVRLVVERDDVTEVDENLQSIFL
jgi:hypothetical protein